MTTNNNPNIVITLVAHGHRATDVWADPHNKSFYLPPLSQAVNGKLSEAVVSKDDRSRQLTPSPNDPGRRKTSEAKLQITFDNKPKNPEVGYLLGSDRELCDIFLGSTDDCISHRMFTISFNQYNEVIMTSSSGNATVVKYRRQKGDRMNFTWIFPPGQEKIFVNAGATDGDAIKFTVDVPTHETDKAAYEANCRKFMQLAISAATPHATMEPPFYLRTETLGNGGFGFVHKARAMPDGRTVAVKYFNSKTVWTLEADILRKLYKTPHDNIVQFIDYGLEDKPYIVMGLAPEGNLEEQRKMKPFNSREIGLLLRQMLHALIFLHVDFGITHGDIKPENILCDSRAHFRLTDFGRPKEGHILKTIKGTKPYMAPEMFANEPYTAAVDVWALGMVIAKLLTGNRLPGYKGDEEASWCTAMVAHFTKYAECCWGPELVSLQTMVQRYMLRMRPQDRESALDCLGRGDYLWSVLDQGSKEGSKMSTRGDPTGAFPNTPPANNANGPSIYTDSGPTERRLPFNEANGAGKRANISGPQHIIHALSDDRPEKVPEDSATPDFNGHPETNPAQQTAGKNGREVLKPVSKGKNLSSSKSNIASVGRVNRQQNNRVPMKRRGSPSGTRRRQKPSAAEPAVEGASDEAATNGSTALPTTATPALNNAQGQTPNLAHLNQAKEHYEGLLMAYMRS